MSGVSSTTTAKSGSTPSTERGLLGHKDLQKWVQFAGAFYGVCVLVLMSRRSGDVLQWALLPFQPGKYIQVRHSFLEFLVVPALGADHPFPSTVCIQTDPDESPLLGKFFTELAASGGPTVSLGMTSTFDDAKLDALFEQLETHVQDMYTKIDVAADGSNLPSLEQVKTAISAFLQGWNNVSNRWENL